MPLILAYIGVVFIWSTTPLAVKISTESLAFPSAALSRMALATALCVGLALLLRVRIPWTRPAVYSYASSTLGTFGGMTLTYAAVAYIPSGLVSVIFGLAPVLSGVAARWLLAERSLTPFRVLALVVALSGLAVVFRGTLRWQPEAWPGLLLTLGAVLLFAMSTVLVKRHSAGLNPLQHTSGSLVLSLPMFVLSWLLLDGQIPDSVSRSGVYTVLYLAVIGSVVAFLLYFRVLSQMSATQAALIPLITPPLAVVFGAMVAGEAVPPETLVGGAMILLALGMYQFHTRLLQVFSTGVPARRPAT